MRGVRLAVVEAAAERRVPLVVATYCYAEPHDRADLEAFEAVLARHGGELLPVFLHCGAEEAARRVGNADRIARRKLSSPEALAGFCARWSISPVPRPNCLVLDTSAGSPDATAREIARHFALGEAGLDPTDRPADAPPPA